MSRSPISPEVLLLTSKWKRATPAYVMKVLTESEIRDLSLRDKLYEEIESQIATRGALSYEDTAEKLGCSPSLVGRGWNFMRKQFARSGDQPANLRLVIPSEGRASDQVDEILAKAGFVVSITNDRTRTGVVIDMQNGLPPIPVEKLAAVDIFRDLDRNKRTPFDLAFVGNDVIKEYKAHRKVSKRRAGNVKTTLKFHCDRFRMCVAIPEEALETVQKQGWGYFKGKPIVTSYPYTARAFFKKQGVKVTVLDAKGGVEVKCRRWGAAAIVDVEETGRSQKAAKLVRYGDPMYVGNISLIEPQKPKNETNANEDPVRAAFLKRLRDAHPQPKG